MPGPAYKDLITLTSSANGLVAESMEERILSCLAMLASGSGPDGTVVTIVPQYSSAPTYVKGALYFDTTLNKLRVGGASAWETVTSA